VGKTVFAALATVSLRKLGFHVAALKPICSGGREDARHLQRAAGKILSLDEVNPWHFRAALAPLLGAQQEKKRLQLRAVVAHIRRIARRFEVVIVEGAGGLLSPLGEDFDSRELINALGAVPVVVCANQLGAVNKVRLVIEALPRVTAQHVRVVLVNPARPNAASKTNAQLLAGFLDPDRFYVMPWLGPRRP
jgi:dethiobiotin synthetase